MNRADDKRDDDEAWLEALAGRPASPNVGLVTRQAQALRTALRKRRALLEADVPTADDALYERIADDVRVFRQRQHLSDWEQDDDIVFNSRHTAEHPNSSISNRKSSHQTSTEPTESLYFSTRYRTSSRQTSKESTESGLLSNRSRLGRKIRTWRWSMAMITIIAAVSAPIWIGENNEEGELILRSGSDATIQIVSNPELRAKELSNLLQAAGVKTIIERKKDGTVGILIEATPEALDILASQRLMPQPKDGNIIIWLEPQKTKKP